MRSRTISACHRTEYCRHWIL